MSDRVVAAPAPGRERSAAEARESWWSEARAVFVKDVRSELRTRAAVATILLFALVTLVVVAFTVPTSFPVLFKSGVDTEFRGFLLAAILWVILFFSAMAGLPRTFVKEEEMRTAAALRLAARPSAVLAGKLVFNGVLVLLVVAVVLPLWVILFTPLVRNWGMFLFYLVGGATGMASGATILGAIVARAGGKSYLMLPLAFPILLPILIFAAKGTAISMTGNPGNLALALVSYQVAMVVLSAMLFEKVWSDA